MNLDTQITDEEIKTKKRKIIGWYCLSSKGKMDTVAFGTYKKPNFIKRFFMRTLLDFHWIKEVEQ
jgi:hypothetical protein